MRRDLNDRTDHHPRQMHSIEEVRHALALVDKGLNDCEIERRTGIPRRTILGWRHGQIPRFARPVRLRAVLSAAIPIMISHLCQRNISTCWASISVTDP